MDILPPEGLGIDTLYGLSLPGDVLSCTEKGNEGNSISFSEFGDGKTDAVRWFGCQTLVYAEYWGWSGDRVEEEAMGGSGKE